MLTVSKLENMGFEVEGSYSTIDGTTFFCVIGPMGREVIQYKEPKPTLSVLLHNELHDAKNHTPFTQYSKPPPQRTPPPPSKKKSKQPKPSTVKDDWWKWGKHG